MEGFRRQLEKGSIQKAHRALLTYMMGLRTHSETLLTASIKTARVAFIDDIERFLPNRQPVEQPGPRD